MIFGSCFAFFFFFLGVLVIMFFEKHFLCYFFFQAFSKKTSIPNDEDILFEKALNHYLEYVFVFLFRGCITCLLMGSRDNSSLGLVLISKKHSFLRYPFLPITKYAFG